MNRIEPILTELNETMDTEDQMLMIMDALNDTVTPVPEPELSVHFYIKTAG